MAWLAVFIGGGFGSMARYAIARGLAIYDLTFPLATLIANLVSSFMLGVLVGWGLKNTFHGSWNLFWIVGFCGGFSTFSTFSSESLYLFQSGHYGLAFLNVLLSLVICIACIYLGIKCIL